MEISNQQIAKILKDVAAALTIKKTGPDSIGAGNIFQIRAYEKASSSIEHSTTEIQDLWEEGKLDQVPAIGKNLQEHLNELFTTGKVKHFEDLKKGIPEVVFSLLDIPGIGPKTAQKIADLGVKDLDDLKKKISSGELKDKGLSDKLTNNILESMQNLGQKENRMLLPYAFAQAEKILQYLHQSPDILQANFLGSLRRMVATIGDLDFAVSSNHPKQAVEYFTKMPGVSRIVDQGEFKATVVLKSGLQVDLLVGDPDSFGALLQHFTGSKAHNIKLRELANNKGYSLSEHGVKQIKNGKLIKIKQEDELYSLLNMQTPQPELREDTGEIEKALKQTLPDLVELKDIKGDLHVHSSFIIKPSHDLGLNTIREISDQAQKLGYEYIGIADHQPSQIGHSFKQLVDIVSSKKKAIEQINSSVKNIRVLNLLEIDILSNGSLGLPDEALKLLDFAIASIHSSFNMTKEQMTKRILTALANPYVKVLGHPTGRLIGKRDSYEVDWEEVFKFAASNNKALEINSYPNRLDLREDLVRLALRFGVKFVINTDAHEISQMDKMNFGVAVARRGWATKEDIVNTWDFKKFAEWFKI